MMRRRTGTDVVVRMGRCFARQSLEFKFRVNGDKYLTLGTGVDIHARDRVGLLFTCALNYIRIRLN